MQRRPVRVLGVDPGSQNAGYGCVEVSGPSIRSISHGTLRLGSKLPFEERLLRLHSGLKAVIEGCRPDVMVVEKAFVARNADSALKLGQSRGVVLLLAAQIGVQIAEYTPTEVKQALTGYGHADKEQLSRMVQVIIGPQKFGTLDASDAVGLAICHAHHHCFQSPLLQAQKKKNKRYTIAQSLGISES